jgi:hypothetical protein
MIFATTVPLGVAILIILVSGVALVVLAEIL